MSDQKPVKDAAPPDEGVSRRQLLVRSLAGAAAAGAAGLGAYAHHKAQGTPHDEMPVGIKDDLAPMDQRDVLWTFCASEKLHAEHPERVEAFGGFNFHEKLTRRLPEGTLSRTTPGYTQLDRALGLAAWEANDPPGPGAAIRPAQQRDPLLGPVGRRVPTTVRVRAPRRRRQLWRFKQRGPRASRPHGAASHAGTGGWDYDPLYDIAEGPHAELGRRLPVRAEDGHRDADRDGLQANTATSPAWTGMACNRRRRVRDGQTNAAGQVAEVPARALGYHAVGSNNDLGMSVPYGVAAGLGEAGAQRGADRAEDRAPPPDLQGLHRLRLRGVRQAPLLRGRFASARSASAAPRLVPVRRRSPTTRDPTWGPEYEGSGDPSTTHTPNRSGILKYHNDSKKCLKFWIENDGGCHELHHRVPVQQAGLLAPPAVHRFDSTSSCQGPAHAFMREMDIVFGYGTTFDQERVKAFWKSGKDMRGG